MGGSYICRHNSKTAVLDEDRNSADFVREGDANCSNIGVDHESLLNEAARGKAEAQDGGSRSWQCEDSSGSLHLLGHLLHHFQKLRRGIAVGIVGVVSLPLEELIAFRVVPSLSISSLAFFPG